MPSILFPEGLDASVIEPGEEAVEEARPWGVDLGEYSRMGEEVREFVKDLKDEKVWLEFDVQERDKYGRLLAYVYTITDISWEEWEDNTLGEEEYSNTSKTLTEENEVRINDFISAVRTGLYDFLSKIEFSFDEIYAVEKDGKVSILVNATIIKAGYAIPMSIPPNMKYAQVFQELYEGAKENGRGLWKNSSDQKG